VGSTTASISAFQADDPGNTPLEVYSDIRIPACALGLLAKF